MSDPAQTPEPFLKQVTRRPRGSQRLIVAEASVIVAGITAAVVQHGLYEVTRTLQWEMGLVAFSAMLFLAVSSAVRYRWSLARHTFVRENRSALLVNAAWVIGILGLIIFGRLLAESLPAYRGDALTRPMLLTGWSELCLVLRASAGTVMATRRAASSATVNPALMLAVSFLLLIAAGTILLMVPRAYADPETLATGFLERLRIALFTATSASCVTGLIVVDTGGSDPYWSRTGQAIIMALFQLGGLGIMTCGAFFAVIAGRHMPIRERATLHELLEADQMGEVRRMVVTILAFTLGAETVGAILISGLWSDAGVADRAFLSVFHAVSAFCNAGFSLTDDSFVGDERRWQIWGVLSTLIVVGGLGFSVIYNLALIGWSRFRALNRRPLFNLSPTRVRLSLNSRLVLAATGSLLILGAIGYHLLEATASTSGHSTIQRFANAWFQSVTFRTAGFNTVPHADLQPTTKLFAIMLMFIGAAPGSTGGGVKVTCLVLTVLKLVAILRGRERVEIAHRTIPDVLVNRALVIIALGVMAVMATTLLLVLFEDRPEAFLDHLFEATSAFATVGVSSIDTATLRPPSQLIIVVTMFLGRVGPLTLLMGLAGRLRTRHYEYPVERVALG